MCLHIFMNEQKSEALSYFINYINERSSDDSRAFNKFNEDATLQLMLESEHNERMRKIRDKRSWPLTIFTGILSLVITAGIIAIWRYIGHDAFMVCATIIPLAIIALMLALAALNGSKRVFGEAYTAIFDLLVWW